MKASLVRWTRPFTCWFMQCHCFCLQQRRTSISQTVTLPLGGTPKGTGVNLNIDPFLQHAPMQ